MADTIYLNGTVCYRADTLENWRQENPVLKAGEPSVVTDALDENWLKIGDGVTAWIDLPYRHGPEGKQGIAGPIGPQGSKGEPGDTYTLTEADKQEIADMAKPPIDQTYSPTSPNAQSGKAVAEAFAFKDFELLKDIKITEDVNSVSISTTDTGEALNKYKDFFIYFLGKFTATESSKALFCHANDGNMYFMYKGLNKSTAVKGFWIMVEEVCTTEKIDYVTYYPNAGTKIYKTTYPGAFLGDVTDGQLISQGLSANNQQIYSDLSISDKSASVKNLTIGQPSSSTSIFASGSRFLLFGRKA